MHDGRGAWVGTQGFYLDVPSGTIAWPQLQAAQDDLSSAALPRSESSF